MNNTREFVVDAIGLVCSIGGWFLMVIAPIEVFALELAQSEHRPSLVTAAVMSIIAIVLGLAAKWVANGIFKRRRFRLAIASLFCALVTLSLVLSSLFLAASSPSTWAVNLMYSAIFLTATFFLLLVAIKRRIET